MNSNIYNAAQERIEQFAFSNALCNYWLNGADGQSFHLQILYILRIIEYIKLTK